MNKNKRSFLLVFLSLGLVWIRSSYAKSSSGNFIATLPDTLGKFASKNPYPWYKDLLLHNAIPNAVAFGGLIMWGEFLVAISITLMSFYMLFNKPHHLHRVVLGLGLLGGILLNVNFWLASGWTSSSTDSLNMLMFLIEIIGLGWVWRVS